MSAYEGAWKEHKENISKAIHDCGDDKEHMKS
jgi:hypothetical protein